jgi:hypothetical protein
VEPIPPVVAVPPSPGEEPNPLPVLEPKPPPVVEPNPLPELDPKPLPEFDPKPEPELVPLPVSVPLPELGSVPPVVAVGVVGEPLLPNADPEFPKDEDEEPNGEPLLLPKEDPEDPNDELPPPSEEPLDPSDEEEPKELFAPPAPLVIPVGVMPFCCICTCCPNRPTAGTVASPRWMMRQSSFPVIGSL